MHTSVQANGRSGLRREHVHVMILVVAGLFARLLFSARDAVLTDSSLYLNLAERISHGYLTVDTPLRLNQWIQPGLSLAIAAVRTIFHDPVTAALVVSMASGIAIILLVYILGRQLFGHTVGIVAGSLIVVQPVFIMLSSAILTESLFVALLLAAVVWFVRLRRRPVNGWAYAGLGLVIGAAYLVRIIGIGPVAVVVGWIMFDAAKKRLPWRSAVLASVMVIAGAGALAVPYAALVSREVGSFSLGGQPVWPSILESSAPADFADRQTMARSLYALNSDRSDYNVNEILVSGTSKSKIRTAVQYTRFFIVSNIRAFIQWFGLFVLFVVVPLFVIFRRMRRESEHVYFLLSWVPVLMVLYLLRTPLYRYYVPVIPLFTVLTAAAAVRFAGTSNRKMISSLAVAAVLVVLVGLDWLNTIDEGLYPSRRGVWHVSPTAVIGREIRTLVGPGQALMGTLPAYAYYAEAKFYPTPVGSVADVIAFARHAGIRYLLVERSADIVRRPELDALFEQAQPEAQLVYRRGDTYLFAL